MPWALPGGRGTAARSGAITASSASLPSWSIARWWTCPVIRRSAAGYEVRLLALEDGSYELNPPTAIEFIKRDLRWCQGNLQYLKLLGVLDTHLIGRIQLFLAILMYVNAPAWLA